MLDRWLYKDGCYVLHSLDMTHSNTDFAAEIFSSFGTHLLDHLAADGVGFPGGQVTVVDALQVYAHLLG